LKLQRSNVPTRVAVESEGPNQIFNGQCEHTHYSGNQNIETTNSGTMMPIKSTSRAAESRTELICDIPGKRERSLIHCERVRRGEKQGHSMSDESKKTTNHRIKGLQEDYVERSTQSSRAMKSAVAKQIAREKVNRDHSESLTTDVLGPLSHGGDSFFLPHSLICYLNHLANFIFCFYLPLCFKLELTLELKVKGQYIYGVFMRSENWINPFHSGTRSSPMYINFKTAPCGFRGDILDIPLLFTILSVI